MRRVLLVLSLFAAVAVLLTGAATHQQGLHHYGTQIALEPVGTEGFKLRAQVTDLASGDIVAGPSLIIPSGESAETESSLPDSDINVRLRATGDATQHSVIYKVEVVRGEEVLSQHAASVRLP